MSKKQVRALQPGDRFITPGGNSLTVVKVSPAWQAEMGYVEVLTREPYDRAGETFIAHGEREVNVLDVRIAGGETAVSR